MTIGRRELTAAWVAIGLAWLLIRPWQRVAGSSGDGLSSTLLYWATAGLAGVTVYCLSKSAVITQLPRGQRFKRLAVMLAFAGTAVCLVGGGVWTWRLISDRNRAWAELEKGEEYEKNGDTHTAISCYSKAIELQPSLVKAYIRRGDIHAHTWPLDTDAAIEDFNKALELDPENAEALYMRGLAYFSSMQTDRGIADFTEVIRLNPKHAESYRFRGQLYLSSGDTTRAVEDATEATKLEPNDAANWYWRSLMFEKMGRLSEAVSDATKAIEVKPDGRDNYSQRAELHSQLGKSNEAIQDLTSALKLSPEGSSFLQRRAVEWRKLNEPEKAELDERTAAEIERRYKTVNEYVKQHKEAELLNQKLSNERKNK